jgi:recombination protein RecT
VNDLMKATAARKPPTGKTLADRVMDQQKQIEVQLAGAMDSAAFVRTALSALKTDDKLMQADSASVLGSIMLAAQLKLEVGAALGHFYLTPRRVNGEWSCLPIIGYRGYIELAYRSNRIESIQTFLVRDGDEWESGATHVEGLWYKHTPKDDNDLAPWTRVVAHAKVKGGGAVWVYLTRAQVLKRRPGNWQSGPWKTHEEEMARKSAIRALAPYMPMSTELGRAIEADEQQVQTVAGSDEVFVTRATFEDEEGDK